MARIRYGNKLSFRLGVGLLVTAILTLVLGIVLLALHTGSFAGASAIFCALVLIFISCLTIYKRKTKLKLYLLLGGTMIAILCTTVMLCLASLAIRQDSQTRILVMEKTSSTDSDKELVTGILVLDVIVLLLGLIDMVPAAIIAYLSWITMEKWSRLASKSTIILIPVFGISEDGILSYVDEQEAIKHLENGNVTHTNKESSVRFGKPLYMDNRGYENGEIRFIHDLTAKLYHNNEDDDAKLEANRLAKEEKENKKLQAKKDKDDKKLELKKIKEFEKKLKQDKNKKKKSVQLTREEVEAVDSIRLAAGCPVLVENNNDCEIAEAFAENAPLDDMAPEGGYTVNTGEFPMDEHDEKNTVDLDEFETTRYNPIFNPHTGADVELDLNLQQPVPDDTVADVQAEVTLKDPIQNEISPEVPVIVQPVKTELPELDCTLKTDLDSEVSSLRSVSFVETPTIIEDSGNIVPDDDELLEEQTPKSEAPIGNDEVGVANLEITAQPNLATTISTQGDICTDVDTEAVKPTADGPEIAPEELNPVKITEPIVEPPAPVLEVTSEVPSTVPEVQVSATPDSVPVSGIDNITAAAEIEATTPVVLSASDTDPVQCAQDVNDKAPLVNGDIHHAAEGVDNVAVDI